MPKSRKPAAGTAPTEPPPSDDSVESPPTGRQLAAAKNKPTGRPLTAAEKQARRATAAAKKGRDRRVRPLDSVPLYTASRALVAQSNHPIVSAFLTAEKLRGGVRKLSRSQWKTELEKFTKAPR